MFDFQFALKTLGFSLKDGASGLIYIKQYTNCNNYEITVDVNEEDYKKAIKFGVRKINYYSYMAREGVYAAREICQKDITFYHEIATFATERMKKDVIRAMNIFYENED